jgi:hypothetical protein
MSKEEVDIFLNSTLEKLSSTPYYHYFYDAVRQVKNRGLLYKILKNEKMIEKVRTKAQKKLKSTNWDKPRIVSILDLKTETKEEPKAFDYQAEVKAMTRFLLRESPGDLIESPKNIFYEIRQLNSEEVLNKLNNSLKRFSKQRIRISALKTLDGFPTDEFLIAKYLSTDNKVIAKVWDRDPKKDMSKDNEFHCCTMPKYGPDYLVDSNVSMLDFFGGGERYARAILMACKGNSDKCLVVDSVEGTRRFSDNHDGKEDIILDFMVESVEKHAKDCGFKYVLFNDRCCHRDFLGDIDLPSYSLYVKPISKNRNNDKYYLEGLDTRGSLINWFKAASRTNYKITGKLLKVDN